MNPENPSFFKSSNSFSNSCCSFISFAPYFFFFSASSFILSNSCSISCFLVFLLITSAYKSPSFGGKSFFNCNTKSSILASSVKSLSFLLSFVNGSIILKTSSYCFNSYILWFFNCSNWFFFAFFNLGLFSIGV